MSGAKGSGGGSSADRAAGSGAASAPFWERPDIVARFAERPPDHRLAKLVEEYAVPSQVTVLDLGCAGGRNAVFLAQRGFDLIALDGARAMVDETRRRVAEILGPDEAAARVRLAAMDRLEGVADGTVDLMVALGVFHNAGSAAEWDLALDEAHRVLARGGRLLVSDFTDKFDPEGKGLVPVEDEPRLYHGSASGHVYLMSAAEMDREMVRHGFVPLRPTETVSRETDNGGRRVTANGLFRKL